MPQFCTWCFCSSCLIGPAAKLQISPKYLQLSEVIQMVEMTLKSWTRRLKNFGFSKTVAYRVLMSCLNQLQKGSNFCYTMWAARERLAVLPCREHVLLHQRHKRRQVLVAVHHVLQTRAQQIECALSHILFHQYPRTHILIHPGHDQLVQLGLLIADLPHVVIVALSLINRTEVPIEDRLGEDFGKDKMQVIRMGYFIQKQLQVAGVADGLGHLGDCQLVVVGQDLLCEVGELAHEEIIWLDRCQFIQSLFIILTWVTVNNQGLFNDRKILQNSIILD